LFQTVQEADEKKKKHLERKKERLEVERMERDLNEVMEANKTEEIKKQISAERRAKKERNKAQPIAKKNEEKDGDSVMKEAGGADTRRVRRHKAQRTKPY
jgi:hypothetical protein